MDEPKTDQPPIGNPDTEPPAEIKAQLRPDDHPEPAKLPDHIAEQPLPRTEQLILPPKDHRRVYLINGLILLLIILAAAAYFVFKNKDNQPRPTASLSSNSSQTASTSTLPGLQLDPNKNYGNKYANGIVPVGDGLYQSSGPKTGYIYTCQGYANNLASSAGGAGQRGPWFVGTSQYDVNKKLHVQGSVMW
ncbi:MAG TPA: hypothetical protein VFK97_00935, partial [Candidatus Saccharimonadales bacterium]|nr:hypothetical protein [Candidatus Saccharimonadales bacterium]